MIRAYKGLNGSCILQGKHEEETCKYDLGSLGELVAIHFQSVEQSHYEGECVDTRQYHLDHADVDYHGVLISHLCSLRFSFSQA